jgi:hypothetical protein
LGGKRGQRDGYFRRSEDRTLIPVLFLLRAGDTRNTVERLLAGWEAAIRMRTTDAKTSELNALMTVLAKMGMTPAARLKMNLQPAELPAKQPTQTEEDKLWDA